MDCDIASCAGHTGGCNKRGHQCWRRQKQGHDSGSKRKLARKARDEEKRAAKTTGIFWKGPRILRFCCVLDSRYALVPHGRVINTFLCIFGNYAFRSGMYTTLYLNISTILFLLISFFVTPLPHSCSAVYNILCIPYYLIKSTRQPARVYTCTRLRNLRYMKSFRLVTQSTPLHVFSVTMIDQTRIG